ILVRAKIEVPNYFHLAKLILSAINGRNRELSAIIEHLLDQDTKALLDALLTQETAADGTAPGKTSAYKLTLLKKLSQSTKPSKVKERVGDSLLIEGLYERQYYRLQDNLVDVLLTSLAS